MSTGSDTSSPKFDIGYVWSKAECWQRPSKVSKLVIWCFTPSQPLRLSQGVSLKVIGVVFCYSSGETAMPLRYLPRAKIRMSQWYVQVALLYRRHTTGHQPQVWLQSRATRWWKGHRKCVLAAGFSRSRWRGNAQIRRINCTAYGLSAGGSPAEYLTKSHILSGWIDNWFVTPSQPWQLYIRVRSRRQQLAQTNTEKIPSHFPSISWLYPLLHAENVLT